LGEEHEKTKESSECLRHLTQQAVVLQKKMNEMYQVCSTKSSSGTSKETNNGSGGSGDAKAAIQNGNKDVIVNGSTSGTASVANTPVIPGHLALPPIHIQPPTMASVLDMLNIINGILFVQIR
jgi:protein TIF31